MDMDPAVVGLPTTTAITGLLDVGAAAIDILSDLNISPQHDTAILNILLREVKECRSSVHAFYKTLNLIENNQIPFPARAAWISLDTLVATLTDTVLAFTRLSSLCCALDEQSNRTTPEDAAKQFEKRIKALQLTPDSPEITPANVGHRPAPYSGTLSKLTTPKALSKVILPIELRELRDDFEYYTEMIPSQTGSCEFPTGGVLMGTPYDLASAR
ncbi:Uncharacterized protein LW93_1590 [Fusarium fujikuroi]|nr:Uncharacterized protein LW93_1590 [Fusarium fujikuroi]